MTTRALDIVTILHAFSVLSERIRATNWNSINEKQRLLFQWLEEYGKSLAGVSNLEALASQHYEELNSFLASRGFNIQLDPFDPKEGIGVVSILDKLVRWLNGPGEKVTISSENGYLPGFEISSGANVYQVDGYPNSMLVELLTKSDDTLWLFVHPDMNLADLDIVELSLSVMKSKRQEALFYSSRYHGVRVPMVDFDIMPDISWLKDAVTYTDTDPAEEFYIDQALQQFKLRMDETGARVKVATAIVGLRTLSFDPGPYVIDKPFYGWWTQKGVPFPMAAFFADWDSLHQPSGSLEDL